MKEVTFTLAVSIDEAREALNEAGFPCVTSFEEAAEQWDAEAGAFQERWFEDNRSGGAKELVSQVAERLTPEERSLLLLRLLSGTSIKEVRQLLSETQFDFIALNAEQAKEGLEMEGWTVLDARDPKAAVQQVFELAEGRAEKKDLAQGLIEAVPKELLGEVIGGLVIRAAK